ncbi:MAG: hypothetical protein HPY76_08270, partial [Anaerolineae bacterium]|nr:hypothetical protein [Anaerolineae bacterium]
PNQQLARELAERRDADGIAELVANLKNPEPNIQSDCIKTLYEIGYLAPDLIAGYADAFLDLLNSKHNRLVWGGMIALGVTAPLAADEIHARLDEVQAAMGKGSVITIDNGIKTLAGVAAAKDAYRRAILPHLLDHLRTCRSKEIAQHSEYIVSAVDAQSRQEFTAILEQRMPEVTTSAAARIRKVLRKASAA